MPQNSLLLKIISIFWITAKLISINVWLTDRLYPVVSLFEFTNSIPPIIHTLLFCFSLLSLFLVLFFPKNTWLLLVILVLELLSCILDVTRWQPWEYQYIFFLLVLILNKKDFKANYNAFLIILASVYIYSGLHKMSGSFIYSIWERMLLHDFFGLSYQTIANNKLHYLGLILPIIETACGFGLLLLKNKTGSALLLIYMHIFILVFIGPLGINHNIVVWPWNVCMILLLYVLFIKKSTPKYTFTASFKKTNSVVLLFWGVLPLLSFAGYWQQYLSSNLYSGNTLHMDICFTNKQEAKHLSRYLSKKDKYSICEGRTRLSLQNWAYSEMNVTPYPEAWYYRRFKKQYEKQYEKNNANFMMYCYPYKEIKQLE